MQAYEMMLSAVFGDALMLSLGNVCGKEKDNGEIMREIHLKKRLSDNFLGLIQPCVVLCL